MFNLEKFDGRKQKTAKKVNHATKKHLIVKVSIKKRPHGTLSYLTFQVPKGGLFVF